jgi:hypothetical protein
MASRKTIAHGATLASRTRLHRLGPCHQHRSIVQCPMSAVRRRFLSSANPRYQEDVDDADDSQDTIANTSLPMLPSHLRGLVKVAKTSTEVPAVVLPVLTAPAALQTTGSVESAPAPQPMSPAQQQQQQQQDEDDGGETDNKVTFVSPSELTFPGNATIPITSHLHIVKPGENIPRGIWPVFRLMVRRARIMFLRAQCTNNGLFCGVLFLCATGLILGLCQWMDLSWMKRL